MGMKANVKVQVIHYNVLQVISIGIQDLTSPILHVRHEKTPLLIAAFTTKVTALPVILPIHSSIVDSGPSQRETTAIYFYLHTSCFQRYRTIERNLFLKD